MTQWKNAISQAHECKFVKLIKHPECFIYAKSLYKLVTNSKAYSNQRKQPMASLIVLRNLYIPSKKLTKSLIN